MHTIETRLADIAAKYSVTTEDLRRYLHEELTPLETSLRLKGKVNHIIADLIADGQGVFCFLLDKTTKSIVRPVAMSDYVGQTQYGISQIAEERGYHVLPRFTHRELASPDYFRAMLSRNPHAGLLAVIPQVPDIIAEVCATMRRAGVIIDYHAKPDSQVYTVNVNNQAAVHQMMNQLFALGHRRIGFITGDLAFASAQERLAGYQQALDEAGIAYDPALVVTSNWSKEQAAEGARDLLPYQPTAIVCSNDLSALGCYQAVLEAGLTIPGDISVTGFDDIDMAATINPPLTTIRQSMTQLGRSAATLLIDVLEQRAPDQYNHMFPLEIVMRGSTAPAPS